MPRIHCGLTELDKPCQQHSVSCAKPVLAKCGRPGRQFEIGWYSKEHPELGRELSMRMNGEFTEDWRKLIPTKDQLPTTPTASRKSAGLICNPLAAKLNNIIVDTADLSPSVNMIWIRHVRLERGTRFVDFLKFLGHP